ncbi:MULTISPECIES: hypothetical protein [Streptomyces]|uniref:Uncharacterized protein n=1 Tax=Streptomyces botrytidirepellens TaxID=2486417 RepID=A0A3M8VMS2_9ACTN|nr:MULTISPECIES: hypothetical protein [Streptomyces]QLH24931.1 hypothetical protein HYQ63_33350 [Streptomyces sp. Rer75]RNG18317.1 hypothetical protein EEJ42_27070 [Streptomyces botrytidirepellens]
MDGVTDSTVLALIGVLLGTAGTLIGQHLANRVEVQRDHRHRADLARSERKEAISGFLKAVQRVELVLDRRKLGMPTLDDPEDVKLHDLWLATKAVELVCSTEAAQAAHDYTKELHALMRSERGRSPVKRERREAFVEVAREELESGRARIRR